MAQFPADQLSGVAAWFAIVTPLALVIVREYKEYKIIKASLKGTKPGQRAEILRAVLNRPRWWRRNNGHDGP
jgi:hypothetical protein